MKKLLRFFCWCLVPVFGAGDLNAQYTSSGPNGGAVNSIYRDLNSTSLYAASSGGIYISTNNGKSWSELNATPASFGCDAFYSVASNGADIYAGSYQSGIYASHDGGNTWVASIAGLNVGHSSPFTDVEIIGPNVLAIRADSGYLYLSTDQGNNWTRINVAIASASAQFLSVHGPDIFVSSPQGLFKSSDNGQSFNNIDPSPADYGKLVWSGDTAYVGTPLGLKMSTDGGQTFTVIGLAGRAVRGVAANGSNIYAIVRNPAPVQDSVLYSNNGGASFSAAPFNPANFRFTVINDLAATPSGVLVGSDYGLYSSKNLGGNWGLSDSGLNATQVRSLAVAGRYVLAAGYPMGVYRAMPDSGALLWNHTGDISHSVDGNVQAMAARGAIIHVAGANGYYRSTDTGLTWTAGAAGATNGNVTSLYASPTTSDVWMIRNGDLYYSSDDGLSFGHIVNSNIPSGASLRVMKADTMLFVSSNINNLYKAGAMMTFSQVSGITNVTAVVYHGNTFYAATGTNGLYSSTNGNTWTPVTITSPGTLPNKINALIPDSAGTGLIAGTDDGFYANTGGTWTRIALAGHVVRSLAIRSGKIFAGTCSGVYSIPYKIITPPSSVSAVHNLSGSMQLWPNPSNGDFSLRVQSLKGGSAELLLRNAVGAVVLHKPIALKAGSNELNVSTKQLSLAAGVYSVQLTGEAIQANARIVLQ